MRDELATQLESALEGAHRRRAPDLGWVVARGRHLRALRRGAIILSLMAVVGVAWTGLETLSVNQTSNDIPTSNDPAPSKDSASHHVTSAKEPVVEKMTEKQQAEVFAFRALAATGLMDAFGKRTYGSSFAVEDVARTASGWRIGFAAMDCQPGAGFTCRGLSGDDPESGNALTDTWVTVTLADGDWRVVEVEGNMPAEDVERLVGFEMPQREEPSHWEFPAVGIWPIPGETVVEMVALWVGPYPTSAPGSVCRAHAFAANGEALGEIEAIRFTQGPPSRPFDRAGWIRQTSVAPDPGLERIEVVCRQSAA